MVSCARVSRKVVREYGLSLFSDTISIFIHFGVYARCVVELARQSATNKIASRRPNFRRILLAGTNGVTKRNFAKDDND